MITVKTLLERTNWARIEREILSLYPEDDLFLTEYKALYWQLWNTDALENREKRQVAIDVFSGGSDVFVSYPEPNPSLDRWGALLGYCIPEEYTTSFEEATLFAYLFVEMFYAGWALGS